MTSKVRSGRKLVCAWVGSALVGEGKVSTDCHPVAGTSPKLHTLCTPVSAS